MPDKDKFKRKFGVRIDEAYGIGIGIVFEILPNVLDKKDICLILCLGKYTIRIGLITVLKEKEEDYEY